MLTSHVHELVHHGDEHALGLHGLDDVVDHQADLGAPTSETDWYADGPQRLPTHETLATNRRGTCDVRAPL